MELLKITLVQSNLVWENKPANLDRFSSLLSKCPPSDVVVLPEMFSTGFSMHSDELAEQENEGTVAWMREQAKLLDAALTGSFIARTGDQYFNRLVWMQPDGQYKIYDKRHLFTYGGEHYAYSPGDQRLVVDWRGWRICPMICYDLRFPVWSRNDDREGGEYYDLALYVANWPARRSHAWKTLLIARAIENQCYVIGVNRTGKDGNGINHTGDSSAVDFAGQLLFRKYRSEVAKTVVLDRAALTAFRRRFPFLSDQDRFKISPVSKD